MLLVLPHYQVVCFKQKTLYDLQGVPAPIDEIANVVSETSEDRIVFDKLEDDGTADLPSKKCARFGGVEVFDIRNSDQGLGCGERPSYGSGHDFLRLLLLHVLLRLRFDGVGMLQWNTPCK